MGQTCSSTKGVDEHANKNDKVSSSKNDSKPSSIDSYSVTTLDSTITKSNDIVSHHKEKLLNTGQYYLLYKKGRIPSDITYSKTDEERRKQKIRLEIRKEIQSSNNNNTTKMTTHIHAIRSSSVDEEDKTLLLEQRPLSRSTGRSNQQRRQLRANNTNNPIILETRKNSFLQQSTMNKEIDLTVDPYEPKHMSQKPREKVSDWVCVSKKLDIYVCDTGLTHSECDILVQTIEHVSKGSYAEYIFAKQTLSCREYAQVAHACWESVHRVTHGIWDNIPRTKNLQLDMHEPHVVKYDVSTKERQMLGMHVDNSKWTMIISLSDGDGLDYHGGGTYFEALDSTVHIQRGHALIFPGNKLRHCGQSITKGLRFLLVGFLVDQKEETKAKCPTTSRVDKVNSK